MNQSRRLGLVAFAALMAIAFLGASSAMAGSTQLCKADEDPCSTGNTISHVHEETLTGNQATLLNGLGNVTCNVLFLGESLGAGKPLVIHGNFTYSNCLRNGQACTVTEISTDSLLGVLRTGHETASVTFESEFNVHCGLFIKCTYKGEGLEATAKGSLASSAENGEITLNEQTIKHVGGPYICAETSKLDIELHPLEAVYVST